jgi:hypothetical protein
VVRLEELRSKRLVEELRQEVERLHARWATFRRLFGDPENADFLNAHFRGFFVDIQDLMINHLIQSLGRLSDPASTHEKDNLSVAAVIQEMPDATDAPTAPGVAGLVVRFRQCVKDLLEHRNKRVAHSDAAVVLGERKLPSILIADVESALKGTAEIVGCLQRMVGVEQTDFSLDRYPQLLGVDGIMRILRQGVACDRRVCLAAREVEALRMRIRDATPFASR